MGLTFVSGGGSPVSTDEMVDQLRLAGVDVQTDLLSAQLSAATEYVQNLTGQQLLTASYKLFLDAFPGAPHSLLRHGDCSSVHRSTIHHQYRSINLPLYPVASVSAVKYYDANGSLQTLDTGAYTFDSSGGSARVGLNPGHDWPQAMDRIAAVEIDFTAGYGDDVEDVPALLVQAVKLLAAHWYENREAATDVELIELPLAVRSILDQLNLQGA